MGGCGEGLFFVGIDFALHLFFHTGGFIGLSRHCMGED